MPRGDRTGPAGQGSRTGRGVGLCSGSSTPGFMNRVLGGWLSRGRGAGSGRGMQGRVVNRVNAEQDTIDRMRSIREKLDSIEKKIKGVRND